MLRVCFQRHGQKRKSSPKKQMQLLTKGRTTISALSYLPHSFPLSVPVRGSQPHPKELPQNLEGIDMTLDK